MGGFEQHYERALQDKNWGKALRLIKNSNDVPSIERQITKCLCQSLRDLKSSGEPNSVQKLMDVFKCCYMKIPNQRILTNFDRESIKIINSEENSAIVQAFYQEATTYLKDHCNNIRKPKTRSEIDDVCITLMVSVLKRFIEAKIEPALGLIAGKKKVSPQEARNLFENAMRDIPLEKIAKEFFTANVKLRAPSLKRRTLKQQLATSLILK